MCLSHIFFRRFCIVDRIHQVNIGMTPIQHHWFGVCLKQVNLSSRFFDSRKNFEIQNGKEIPITLFLLCWNAPATCFPKTFKRPPIWQGILLLWTIDVGGDLSSHRSPLRHPATGPDGSHAGDLWLHRWRRCHGTEALQAAWQREHHVRLADQSSRVWFQPCEGVCTGEANILVYRVLNKALTQTDTEQK